MVNERLADISSIIRVLNKTNSEINYSGNDTIFFKSDNESLVTDLESFVKRYQPIVTMNVTNIIAP